MEYLDLENMCIEMSKVHTLTLALTLSADETEHSIYMEYGCTGRDH